MVTMLPNSCTRQVPSNILARRMTFWKASSQGSGSERFYAALIRVPPLRSNQYRQEMGGDSGFLLEVGIFRSIMEFLTQKHINTGR